MSAESLQFLAGLIGFVGIFGGAIFAVYLRQDHGFTRLQMFNAFMTVWFWVALLSWSFSHAFVPGFREENSIEATPYFITILIGTIYSTYLLRRRLKEGKWPNLMEEMTDAIDGKG